MHISSQPYGSWRVLSLGGRLDRLTAPAVHRQILIALAEHQQALVCDVGQLQVTDPMALVLFRGIGLQARYWPGAPVVLCRPDPETRDHLHRLGVDRVIPIRPSLAAAADLARRRAPTSGDALHLPPLPAAARAARDFVRSTCRDYAAETVETAVLLVNELVSQALRHAGSDLGVHLSLDGNTIRLGVSDDDPRLPHRLPRTTGAGGAWVWELRVLNALADRWGALPTAQGKLVWCLLRE